MKSRWEKKVKSRHKVLNRKKRIEQYYGRHNVVSPKWADTGCVCSCSLCSAKNSCSHKSERKQLRYQELKEIDEHYREVS